jgi:integrase
VSKRPKGTGSIRERSDGRFEARVTVDGNVHSAYGRTKSEAQSKLKQILSEAQAGTLRPPSHLTIAEYLDWWLETSERRLKPSSHATNADIVRVHLKPAFGNVKLEKLSASHLDSLYSKCLASGLSVGRTRRIHATVRKALNDAVRLDLIATNVSLRATPPRLDQIEPELWSMDELRQFLVRQAAAQTRWTPLWLVLLATGLRLGEALGLAWNSVDLPRASLQVKQALMTLKGMTILTTPKTRAGRRVLSLPELAIQALKDQGQQQVMDRLAAGGVWPHEGFVFLTQTGEHPARWNLLRSFKAACDDSGVRRLRIHDLRHLSASLLVMGGADVKSLQKRLGHASLQTTLGIYAHVLTDTDEGLAARMDDALGTALGGS